MGEYLSANKVSRIRSLTSFYSSSMFLLLSPKLSIVQYVEELLGSYVKGLEIQDSEGITTATFSHENVVFIGLQASSKHLCMMKLLVY